MSLVSCSLKPAIPKKHLMLVAAVVWTIAGFILFVKGFGWLQHQNNHLLLHIFAGVIFGIMFYLILFHRISKKHITRITNIIPEKPCLFSFFDKKSYLMMFSMITLGIALRKLNIVNPEYLYTFYIGMGTPLLISAFRFFKTWINSILKTD